MGRYHRRIFFFAAESAACLELNHANFLRGQSEKRGERFVHVVMALQRAPDGDAFVRIRSRDHSLRLDVELLLRAGFVFAFDDFFGRRKRGVHVAFVHGQ